MKVLGIRRAAVFSPHSRERDGLTFDALTNELRRRGHEVDTVAEEELATAQLHPTACDVVFSMARARTSLERLARYERDGGWVVNSPSGLLMASRAHIYQTCRRLGVAAARQCDASAWAQGPQRYPCWLKRDDACAQEAGDVSFLRSEAELAEVLARLRRRGVTQCVVAEHLSGDLIKFYGVAGTPFFFYSTPKQGGGFSKFGLEQFNDAFSGYAFDSTGLKRSMDRLAARLRMPVYGGDAIVGPDGVCRLIDFNDWPSFSACRAEAVRHMADYIEHGLDQLRHAPHKVGASRHELGDVLHEEREAVRHLSY